MVLRLNLSFLWLVCAVEVILKLCETLFVKLNQCLKKVGSFYQSVRLENGTVIGKNLYTTGRPPKKCPMK